MTDVIDQFATSFSNLFVWLDSKNSRSLHYIPYLNFISKVSKKEPLYKVEFNGGVVQINLKTTETILIHGCAGSLPVEFLFDASANGVSMVIHRTHDAAPFLFFPADGAKRTDVLSRQILVREDGRLKKHIVSALIRAKVESQAWLLAGTASSKKEISAARSIAEIRQVEAKVAARYWNKFYESIDLNGLSRREAHPINSALNATSHYLIGSIQRWVFAHGMSPFHGYLHEPTNYPALIYDLIEPYRWLAEKACKIAFEQDKNEKTLSKRSLEECVRMLKEPVWVPLTRQRVYRKMLLQGVVLSLRSFLIGNTMRFALPREGARTAGQPRKSGFKLPGELK